MRTAAVLLVLLGLMFAAPAHADSGCTNGQPEAIPQGPGQQVIVDYFRAVNDRNYGIAWGFLAPSMHDMYGTLPDFVSIMNQHVKCVRVTKFLPVVGGAQSFRVVFDDEYLVPFEAGSGALPLFYKVSPDQPPLIVEQATSPLT
jgi:hypothetical protein